MPHCLGLGRALDRKKNAVVLNFTFQKWGRRIPPSPFPGMTPLEFAIRACAVHEFGHALGIAHEHNRDDAGVDPKVCPSGGSGDIKVGAYDADSCMNYRNAKWGNHGQLSAGDIATIKFMYPAAEPVPLAAAFTGSGTAGKATLELELRLTQEKSAVKGFARIRLEDGGEVRQARVEVQGWRVNGVAVLYPKTPGGGAQVPSKILVALADDGRSARVETDAGGRAFAFQGTAAP